MLLEILDFIVDFMGEHTFLAVLISVILYLLFKGLRLHIQTKPQADYEAWCAENTDKELRKEFEKLVELSNQNPEKKTGDWLWKGECIYTELASRGKRKVNLSRLMGYKEYIEKKKADEKRKAFEAELEEKAADNKRYAKAVKSKQPKSVVKNAVVGGVIAGPVGAIVGAVAAADKNNRIRK